jgi:bifunctional DNase/RNase
VSKIELEILGLTSSQSQSGSFALVLGEKQGKRRLPIIIGMFEAQAIAVEIERMKPSRPMTHDLFKDFILKFNIELIEIRIEDLKEGIYYSKIIAKQDQKTVEFDARPSDAIAMAVRFNTPIFTNEKIMKDSGISPSEMDEADELSELEKELEDVLSDSDDLEDESIADITLEDLHFMLDQALANENYEEAARLRDEINKRS